MNKIKNILKKIPISVYFALITLLLIPCYYYGWNILTNTITSYLSVMSNITVNFVLFLFLYGIIVDKYTKKMSKRKGWLIFIIGFIILVLFFKYVGGMETIF
jgi:hypothetical protein